MAPPFLLARKMVWLDDNYLIVFGYVVIFE
jgi:hypothetical protein